MTEKKIKELQEQVAEREKYIVKTEKAATALGKVIERRETQVKTLQIQLTDLKQKNQGNEGKIKELEGQINKLKEEAKEAENKIGGLEAKVLQLTTELTNTKSELDDKKNELEKEQEKSKQLANDLETANKKIDSLNQEINDLKQTTEKNEQKIAELEKQNNSQQEQNKSLQNQLEQSQKGSQELNDKINSLEQQVKKLNEELKQKEQTITSLEEKSKGLEEQIKENQKELATEKEKSKELQKQLEEQKKENEQQKLNVEQLGKKLETTQSELQAKDKDIERLKVQISQLQEQNNTQILNAKKRELNSRLANLRTALSVQENDLQAKYTPRDYQSTLNESLTLNNLEQLENTIRAVICICATETATKNVGEKLKPNEVSILLNNLNLIKAAWGQTTSEISKENNPLYLEIIDKHSEHRQQVKNLIQKLQQQQQPQLPQTSLDEVINQAKNAKSVNELQAAINSLNFFRNSQDEEIKKIYEQRKQEVDDLYNLLELKLKLTQQVENALDISQDSKDGQEDIFEKRRQARSNLENFAELTSPQAQQAYQEVNQGSKVTNCIEKLAEKLWNYLRENEKKAGKEENKEFLQALTSNGYNEGTEKYKLYWIIQGMYKEFVKNRLDDKKRIKFYPYVTVPNTNGHTNPIITTETITNSSGKIISSIDSLEGFDLNLNFKKSELQILSTFAHEISHNVVQLKEHKKLLPGDQSHSKPFWEGYYVNNDSTLAYLTSCLSLEKQKELKNVTNLLSNPEVSNFHLAYCLESGNLEGKARIKKYFKEEEIAENWHSARQLVLGINNNSMNEDLKNWESESEKNKRWVKAQAFHKTKIPTAEDKEEGKQEYKVYVFFDPEKIPDSFKETIKSTFSPEEGWKWKKKEDADEEVEIIDADKIEKSPWLVKAWEDIKCGCCKQEKNSTLIEIQQEQEAKIIDNPPPMVKPNK